MTDHKHCQTCGAKTVEYRHKLNKGLTGALIKLYEHRGSGLLSEMGMTTNQFCNFQKLRYWRLVEKIDDEGRGGQWCLTQHGLDFITGLDQARECAISYRGEAIRTEGKYIDLKNVVGDYDFKPYYAKTAIAVESKIQKQLFNH